MPTPARRARTDPSRIAGGSSSGSGAARLAPAALGTDTGASVRLPAALNGVAGFRPSVGRYDGAGITPISHTRDTPGPLAASMEDIALLDAILAGEGQPAQTLPAAGLRLGLPSGFWAGLEPEVERVTRAALDKLRGAGVELIALETPGLAEANAAVSMPVCLHEAKTDLTAYLERYETGVDITQVVAAIASPDVKGLFDGMIMPVTLPGPDGAPTPMTPLYEAALATHRDALIAAYRSAFASHRLDALLFPTLPVLPITADAQASGIEHFMRLIRNTDPGSNAGLPGLNIPAGCRRQACRWAWRSTACRARTARCCPSAWRWRPCWAGWRRRRAEARAANACRVGTCVGTFPRQCRGYCETSGSGLGRAARILPVPLSPGSAPACGAGPRCCGAAARSLPAGPRRSRRR